MVQNIIVLKKLKRLYKTRLTNINGRNNLGRICVYHRGGGPINIYSKVDFIRNINSFGIVIKIYKFFRYSAFIGLIYYYNGLVAKTLIPDEIKLRDIIFAGRLLNPKLNFNKGSAIPIKNINLFTKICNVELYPFQGMQLVRAAGGKALIISRIFDKNQSVLKLKSG